MAGTRLVPHGDVVQHLLREVRVEEDAVEAPRLEDVDVIDDVGLHDLQSRRGIGVPFAEEVDHSRVLLDHGVTRGRRGAGDPQCGDAESQADFEET